MEFKFRFHQLHRNFKREITVPVASHAPHGQIYYSTYVNTPYQLQPQNCSQNISAKPPLHLPSFSSTPRQHVYQVDGVSNSPGPINFKTRHTINSI